MNQELMDMAAKAGIEFTNDPTETPMTTFAECWIEELEAFAALVAAAEREKSATALSKILTAFFAQGTFEQVEKLTRADEREACAELRNTLHPVDAGKRQDLLDVANRGLDEYQALIRARGETK
jgi:hypothetical protein